ncbi:MAG TPA: hypothetical protein VGC74_17225 [Stenotrophomonas sp.]
MPTRDQLDADLNALEQMLPVQGTADDASFDYNAFQARVAELIRVADPPDQEYVRERANCMLGAAGLVPSDNEGQSCG